MFFTIILLSFLHQIYATFLFRTCVLPSLITKKVIIGNIKAPCSWSSLITTPILNISLIIICCELINTLLCFLKVVS